MLGSKKGDAGAALRALEEAAAPPVVAQQVLRRRRGAVAVGTADVGHEQSVLLYVYPVNAKFFA